MNEPFTAMQEAIYQLHELYKSCLEAGFTEPQAMAIVLKAIEVTS